MFRLEFFKHNVYTHSKADLLIFHSFIYEKLLSQVEQTDASTIITEIA